MRAGDMKSDDREKDPSWGGGGGLPSLVSSSLFRLVEGQRVRDTS